MTSFHDRAGALPVTEFAFPGPVRDTLNAAILAGEKTSTTSLFDDYAAAGEELPQLGQRYQLAGSDSEPLAIVEVTEVRVVRLGDVDLQHALDEGEGFATVAEWRAVHEGFWNGAEYAESTGGVRTLDDDCRVVLERFRVVETPGD